MFLAGLRSGFVRSLALSRGEAGRPLVQALLATMTRVCGWVCWWVRGCMCGCAGGCVQPPLASWSVCFGERKGRAGVQGRAGAGCGSRTIFSPAGRPPLPCLAACLAAVQSADAETAGAAFVTLMALMGCGAGGGGGGAGGSQGSGEADAEAEGEEAGDCLMLDAHYGLPGQVAAAAAAAGAGPGGGGGGSGVLPACRLACIPTDAELMEALRANGYQPGSGASASGGGDTSGGRGGRHQGSAAAAAQQQEEGGGSKEGQEGVVVRLQAIKLILRTAAAVCRYCAQVGAGWGGGGGGGGAAPRIPSTHHPPCERQLHKLGVPTCPHARMPAHACIPARTPAHPPPPPTHPPAAPGGPRGGGRHVARGPGRAVAGVRPHGAGPSRQPASAGPGCRHVRAACPSAWQAVCIMGCLAG